MPTPPVPIEDHSTSEGPIFLTGIQALARLPIAQALRDRRAGLATAGFVSGYRGSPLAGFDRALTSARSQLEAHRVHFQPGLNEELAATAVWGSQMVNAFAGARCDGVFGLWYGKAPGVDRAGDALKHANAAGTSRFGGVLAVAGDDHACKSSTLPSQSEFAFLDAGIPVLNPADVQEVLDLGLVGWALSRFAGCWVALIALADTMDSSATLEADPERVRIELPGDFAPPPGGLHFRRGLSPQAQEELVHGHRLAAALAFARANGIDRTLLAAERPRLGIVTTGKATLDVRQALEDLGIDPRVAGEIGLALYQVRMPWPLDGEGLLRFAAGLEEVLVVEEKRPLLEDQIKARLYDASLERPPRVVGKRDERGAPLLPATGDLSPAAIARVLAGRLEGRYRSERIRLRLAEIDSCERSAARAGSGSARQPFYCSGCPHSTSTVVPEGSRGLAGIGCHYMVRWMDRSSDTFSQMGGEGVHWIGQAPFTSEPHVFANLGDGTYHHSGLLAIRAAVAAGVNITYKILFNDAVAMTGGQALDGPLTVPQITRQLAAEGVSRIAVVSDEPRKYPEGSLFAPQTTIHHRDELDRLQRELRELQGPSAIVYDQTCAAELRRRRKRGLAPDPPLRVFINEAVCEGCGDCSAQSNCASIEPLETEFGLKRQIHQSSCNKDVSCLKGLCPSFVTVRGGKLRRADAGSAPVEERVAALPEPELPPLSEPFGMLITGIGGTGVVTIGALLGAAAHREGRGVTVLDMTGLAQKGGAVLSHVRIAARPGLLHAPRIGVGKADALLACDPLVAASPEALSLLQAGRTRSVVNTHVAPTAEFVRRGEGDLGSHRLLALVHDHSREISAIDASRLAEALFGDGIATNTFLLGYAFQKGLVPLSGEALRTAIERSGVAVAANLRAFGWGRLAADDPEGVERAALPARAPRPTRTLPELVARRAEVLTAYQDAALAERYRARVEEVRRAESLATPGREDLTLAVARSYFKLLATKDEYEVARLTTNGEFLAKLRSQLEGDFAVELHLAPPLWARRDPVTGRPRKRAYGAWMFLAMRVLARLKWLRGTRFDVFGYSPERRRERRLIAEYEATLAELVQGLAPEKHELAVEIASLPEEIRGFDQVKLESVKRAKAREARLLELFRKPAAALAGDAADYEAGAPGAA